jgi:hypothetical protein
MNGLDLFKLSDLRRVAGEKLDDVLKRRFPDAVVGDGGFGSLLQQIRHEVQNSS